MPDRLLLVVSSILAVILIVCISYFVGSEAVFIMIVSISIWESLKRIWCKLSKK